MAKTIEEIVRERMADPRAMRGAITMAGNKPRLTFGAVGPLDRLSIEIDGNKLTIADDPRKAEAEREKRAAEAEKAEAKAEDEGDKSPAAKGQTGSTDRTGGGDSGPQGDKAGKGSAGPK